MEAVEIRFVMTGDLEADLQRVRAAAKGLGTDSYGVNQKIEQGAREASKGQSALNNEIKETSNALDNAGKQATQTGSTLSQLKNMIGWAAIAAGAKQLVGEIINVRAEFEKYEAVLTNTLGSNTLAKQAIGELTDYAAKTPFALSEVTDAYVRLTNYGLQPSMEAMKSYGDLSASVGKNIVDFSEAVADATTGEFERLKEFGIKASKEGDKVTFNFKEKKTTVANTTEAIEAYLISLGKVEGVEGSMEAISKTLGGSISNLGDSWDKLMNTLGGESTGAFSMAIKGLSDLIGMLDMAAKSSETLRKEAVQGNIASSKEGTLSEVNTITASLVGNGMDEKEAKKRAVELYKKQLEEQIAAAQAEYDKALAAGKESKYKNAKQNISRSKSNLEILQGELEVLPTLFTDPKKPETIKPKDADKQLIKGTIKYLEDELKKLQAKTGTFTSPEKEAENIKAIATKTEEIQLAWQAVRDKITEADNADGKLTKVDSQKAALLQVTKTLQLQLAPMKKLTAEEEKQLKIQQEIAEKEFNRSEKAEQLRDIVDKSVKGLGDAADITGSLADFTADFNGELSDSLKTIEGITASSANFVANIASGNWVGAIGSGLNLITQLNDALKDEDAVVAIGDQIKQIEEISTLYQQQYELLLAMGYITPLENTNKEIDRLNTELDAKMEVLKQHELYFRNVNNKSFVMSVGLSDMTDDELAQFLANPTTFLENRGFKPEDWTLDVSEGMKPVWEAVKSMLDTKAELEQTLTEKFGISTKDIATSIANGVADGLKLGADGALGEFGDSFEDIMKKAAIEAVNATFNAAYAKKLQDQIAVATGIGSDGGETITEAEYAAMQKTYRDAIIAAQKQYEAFGVIMGQNTDIAQSTAATDNTLKGSFKTMSEQTAGAMEGKMLAIQMNTIDMRDIMASQLKVQHEIADNTRPIADMATDIASMKTTLKKIADGSTQTQPINI